MSDRPLSNLVKQGWEVRHYSCSIGDSGMLEHCFHLARRSENKVLRVRKKVMGGGVVGEEIDV